MFAEDEVLKRYSPEEIGATGVAGPLPVAVMGPRDTPRMYAQLGTFTLTHINQDAIEDVADRSHVWRLIIPSDAKPQIAAELASLKITKLTLFPELDNVGDLTREVLT